MGRWRFGRCGRERGGDVDEGEREEGKRGRCR